MDTSFWNGRKVFVTGHTGFKGSWLCLWLQRLSADVVGYALPAPTDPSLFEAADVAAGMVSIVGDVRDSVGLRQSLVEHQPDIIFHMAAQSVVRLSYQDPVETYSTNVMGTVHLLDAVRHLPRRVAIVNVTSDKSYENREWIWGYRETDRLGGFDPYSNSKACSELVTQAFADSYFRPNTDEAQAKSIATARAGNVIGGGDWTRDQLVPDVLKAFNAGRPVVLRNPGAVRPWQFVLDCLGGYMTLAERLHCDGRKHGGPWTFGPSPDDTVTVLSGSLMAAGVAAWPVDRKNDSALALSGRKRWIAKVPLAAVVSSAHSTRPVPTGSPADVY
ncbi:MAG: CDP-glucose 4,6-dehydratase, partial [Betaproteobacteria bacterium]